MNEDLPVHLISTKSLIDAAFPNGVKGDEYRAVLKVLHPYLSDRNLADVVAPCCGFHPVVVSNDVGKVATMVESEFPALDIVLRKLKQAGLGDWIREDN
jgi:hypothetical protein